MGVAKILRSQRVPPGAPIAIAAGGSSSADADQTRRRECFTFGPEREQLDAENPDPYRSARSRLLCELPPALRDFMRSRLPLRGTYEEFREHPARALAEVGYTLKP